MQRLVMSGVEQRLDRLQPQLAFGPLAQGSRQPATQLAAAHRGCGAIDHAEQRAVGPIGQADFELQVAARRGIDQERVAALLAAQSAQVRQGGFLRVAHVLQQATGGTGGEARVGQPEAGEIAHAELLAERARRGIGLEMPRWP